MYALAGLFALGVAAFADNFYPAFIGRSKSTRPTSKWLGRLWFVGGALFFFYLAAHFYFKNR
jgi:hypothetical protein